jgi:hypothetical protein
VLLLVVAALAALRQIALALHFFGERPVRDAAGALADIPDALGVTSRDLYGVGIGGPAIPFRLLHCRRILCRLIEARRPGGIVLVRHDLLVCAARRPVRP